MAARHRSRELAVQLTYQWDLNPTSLSDPKVLDRFWREQAAASDDTREYFETLVKGVADHLPQLDQLIQDVAKNWRLDRLEKVDLAVMRVAVFEMLYLEEIPTAVAIDEAVEISKRFGNKDSPSFINGLLDAMVKKGKVNFRK